MPASATATAHDLNKDKDDNAGLGAPHGVEVSADGSTIYVADTEHFQVRAVGPDGFLRTVAGSNDGGDSGDGGGATRAALNYPYSSASTVMTYC